MESVTALAAARRAIDKNRTFLFGNVGKLESEFYELELYTSTDRLNAVDIALSEIKPEERCGPDPPGNVSFPPYSGRTLYAFKWKSPEFECDMYLKFCLVDTDGLERLVLYSFHKDKV